MFAQRTLASPLVCSAVMPMLWRMLIRYPGQVGKLLGERWKALNEKQRAPYDAKAATDKKRYEDEKANYQVSMRELVECTVC